MHSYIDVIVTVKPAKWSLSMTFEPEGIFIVPQLLWRSLGFCVLILTEVYNPDPLGRYITRIPSRSIYTTSTKKRYTSINSVFGLNYFLQQEITLTREIPFRRCQFQLQALCGVMLYGYFFLIDVVIYDVTQSLWSTVESLCQILTSNTNILSLKYFFIKTPNVLRTQMNS